MKFDEASKLFNCFVDELKALNIPVQTGVFGADMEIEFVNIGPTTIILDSKQI